MVFCVIFDNRNCLKKSKSGRIFDSEENVENPTDEPLASDSMPSLESAP